MNLWTTKLVRHFIYMRFGLEYCRERVRQVLHELGFRLRRLRHRHLRAKPQEQTAFAAELQTLLDDWPDDAELLFVDEATGISANRLYGCGRFNLRTVVTNSFAAPTGHVEILASDGSAACTTPSARVLA